MANPPERKDANSPAAAGRLNAVERIAVADSRTAQADTQTNEANTRTDEAEARTSQAELRTERIERGAQALRASELSYRRLFEAARDGILILDVATGRVTDVNPFLVELLGFSHAEMVGRTVGELSPFKDAVSNQAMLERLQSDGFVRYEDLPLETRDGRRIAVEFVSNVYLAGDLQVIQCNIRDITERKVAEAAMTRLAAIVESSSDAIISKDLDFIVTSWNRGAANIFGYTAAEMVGTSILRLIPLERQEEERGIIAQLKRGERVERIDAQRRCKDGRVIDVSITVSPIKDVAGVVIGVSKVAHDISARRSAEEKSRLQNLELEQRVAERTAQLREANEELEAFSYSVSHDLRAPLRHVIGFVAMLQQEAGPTLSAKSARHLTTIADSAARMGQLIDDLLTFARIGRTEMNLANVALDQIVADTVKDFETETKERRIEWVLHPLPVVRADRALLRMVFVNLIANAVKFTAQRSEARIEIGANQGGPDEIVIFVRDNGAGFDPVYAENLFGVFQRLHSQSEFEGTGIGLANVERIVRRHGGRVWAIGAVDQGATFFFAMSSPMQT